MKRARLLCASLLCLATFTAAQPVAPADGELVFVLAVFRHGVRAPLAEFAAKANEHAGLAWPATSAEWGANDWGDLTTRGAVIASRLGEYYGTHYTAIWPAGLNAYLWADVDQRTKATANAIAIGMRSKPRVEVAVDWREAGADPLFHPFKAGCGTPARNELKRIAERINNDDRSQSRRHGDELAQLDKVLGCAGTQGACRPLSSVKDVATPWDGKERSAPIQWKGRYSYASSATEAFLLQYANGMRVAWGREPKIGELLRLHEFYFDKTQREPYLAKVGSSALLREISDQINRKLGGGQGGCPRGDGAAQFVGLVGHDTNLANLNALLHLDWRFADVPGFGMPGFPANDALPAGALVFEVYKRGPAHSVRIEYVSFTPDQMRSAGSGEPFRLRTTCNGVTPCDIPIDRFNTMVSDALGTDNPFVPSCTSDGKQACLPQ